MSIPSEVRDRVRDAVWERAQDVGWSALSDADKSNYYTQWTRETTIGGVLAHYMDARKVRVYIKDSLLKPYERARVSGTEEEIRVALDASRTVEIVQRYVKPHGLRFADEKIICWGNSRDWKLILMAMYERSARVPGSTAAGAALLETGHTADASMRALIRGAASRLGIIRIEWLEKI